MISERISDDIPPQMKILIMVISILMHFCSFVSNLERCEPHNDAHHPTKRNKINDQLSGHFQSFFFINIIILISPEKNSKTSEVNFNLYILYHFPKNLDRTITFNSTRPRSAVGNVSGYRCEADCRSRDRELDPGPVPYFRGD